MSTSAEYLDRAAGLAALPAGDPEREEVFRLAESDERLHATLRQGERLVELLGSYQPAPPSPDVLRRVSDAVIAEIDAESAPADVTQRAPEWKAGQLWLPAAVLLAWGGFLLLGQQSFADGPRTAWSVALLSIALISAFAVVRLAGLVVAATVAAGALFAAISAHAGGASHAAASGLHCTGISVLGGIVPLLAATGLAVTGRLRGARGATLFAGVAGAGALAGVAALELLCGADTIGHELVFHASGVVLAALFGLLVGSLAPIRRALLR